MAITETGLGWYADSSWLAIAQGNIGTIGSGSIGTLPAGWVDITDLGTYTFDGYTAEIASINPGLHGFAGHIYCCPGVARYWGPDGTSVYWSFQYWVSDEDVRAAGWTNDSPTNQITYRGVSTYSSFWAKYYYNNRAFWIGCSSGYGGDPALWHNTGYLIIDLIDASANTRTINPASSANMLQMAALITGASILEYNKTSQGYAVACMCKWKETVGGDVYVSPILISNINANTNWAVGTNVPIQQLSEHSFEGMNFFMRLYKSHIDDGSVITSSFPIVDLSDSIPLSTNLLFALLASRSSLGVGYPPAEEDPYGDGGNSAPAGGGGTFDDTGDTIEDSSQPTYSFAASGFARIYNPTLAELNSLSRYLWTDTNFLQTVINHLKQLLENPVDAIISVSMLPVNIPNGTPEEVKIMYIPTGVNMAPATTQFVDVDCGSLFIDEYYGSALDYNPYTKISLFLPFVGMVELDTDEVTNKTIFIKYRVDIVSGNCIAKVFVGDTNASSCLYQFSGDCSVTMPLNSADFSAYRAAVIGAAKAVMAGVSAAGDAITAVTEAAGQATAETAGAIAGDVSTDLISSGTSLVPFSGPASGDSFGLGGVSASPQSNGATIDLAKFADAAHSRAVNTAGEVLGGKIAIQHSSGFSGNSGMLGIRRPYVIIKRPNMCNPEQYGKYNGRPCGMYLNLATLTGYTEVQNVQLTGFSATNPELSEIANFLQGGVVL